MTSESHPRGLYLLFFVEAWERFSYYGMRAIFVLFLTKALMMSKEDASNIYGSYTGLVYLTPLLGGYISDRYWGNRFSIIFGSILMALGQFLMFMSGSSLGSMTAQNYMLGGLFFLILGNGFFKPNISTMIGQLYPKGDSRIDGAFTIFYMGINLGAMFSPLICGWLGERYDAAGVAIPEAFRWGFLAACIGMLISLTAFLILKNRYIVDPDGNAVGMVPTVAAPSAEASVKPEDKGSDSMKQLMTISILGIALVGVFRFLLGWDWVGSGIFGIAIAAPIMIITDTSLTSEERERIWVIFILAFFVIFFWSAFEQAGASLTMFAEQQTDRVMSVFIPGWIILGVILATGLFLSNFLTWFFYWEKKTEAILSVAVVLAFSGIYAKGLIADFSIKEIPASWFQSINALGIVVLAPFFSMFWAFLNKRDMEPSSPFKMAMGLALLSLGYLVIAMGVKGVSPNVKVSMLWLVVLYVLHTMGELCLSPIGLSMVAKLAPARFASLLMGTWFLASATANKFAGTLSALMPPGAGEQVAATAQKIPSILGYQIVDLYSFFMVFVVMSGLSALILFGIFRVLVRMMHGVK